MKARAKQVGEWFLTWWPTVTILLYGVERLWAGGTWKDAWPWLMVGAVMAISELRNMRVELESKRVDHHSEVLKLIDERVGLVSKRLDLVDADVRVLTGSRHPYRPVPPTEVRRG